MDRKVLFADQSIEIGNAESTAAPMAVAPIKTNLRIVILPAKRGHDCVVFLHHWSLDGNQKTCFSRIASGLLSYLPFRGSAFLSSQFLHN
jgi:hypothetical protein